MSLIPKTKINDTITKIHTNLDTSVDDILKVEEYFKKFKRNDSEVAKLNQLIELKQLLTKLRNELTFYK